MALTFLVALLSGCGEAFSKAGAEAVRPDTREADSSPAPRGTPPASPTNQITIDNFAFQPPRLTVPAGTRVTWTNRDDVPHTVTSSSKPRLLDSGTLDTDDHFEHVFTTPGTYDYFCAVHPHMTGQVIVK